MLLTYSDRCETDTPKFFKRRILAMEENKIVIVSDNDNVIEFDDVTIKHDTVNRLEVAEVEAEIAKLESDKVAIDERIVELKAKVLYAKKVIEIADAAKVTDESTDAEPVVDVENNEEIDNETPEVDD